MRAGDIQHIYRVRNMRWLGCVMLFLAGAALGFVAGALLDEVESMR